VGFQAPLARASIRVLGRREFPAQTMYLSLLVERHGGGLLVNALEALAGALRLLDRIPPGTL